MSLCSLKDNSINSSESKHITINNSISEGHIQNPTNNKTIVWYPTPQSQNELSCYPCYLESGHQELGASEGERCLRTTLVEFDASIDLGINASSDVDIDIDFELSKETKLSGQSRKITKNFIWRTSSYGYQRRNSEALEKKKDHRTQGYKQEWDIKEHSVDKSLDPCTGANSGARAKRIEILIHRKKVLEYLTSITANMLINLDSRQIQESNK